MTEFWRGVLRGWAQGVLVGGAVLVIIGLMVAQPRLAYTAILVGLAAIWVGSWCLLRERLR